MNAPIVIKERVYLLLLCIMPFVLYAQENIEKETKGEFYFSWGYNAEWYTHSNIHISQPSLGNSYTFEAARAHDHTGWDKGIFSEAVTIPQYNYRLGYIFNDKKGWGFEISFDHTKYILADQNVHIKGTLNNKPFNGTVKFAANNSDSSSHYYLNNGANFLLFNIVKRWHLFCNRQGSIKLDGYAKTGIGPVIPHVDNKFFTQPENDGHFQLGGLNVGLEGTVKVTFFNCVFLEYCNKLDYARYWGLRSYKGTASQGFGTYEMILNLGGVIPIGRSE